MNAATPIASRQINWINVFFLTTTAVASVALTPMYVIHEGWHWGLFALFLVYGAMSSMSITAGYHRFLAHRSYDAKPLVELAYLLVGAAAFQGSALQWCADHRRHHRFVDTDRDPHNIRRGFFWAHMGWLFFREPKETASVYPPDMKRDRLVMWQHNYYVVIALTMGFGVPTLIGWAMGHPYGGLLFGGVLRTFFTNHNTFFINSLAHTVGTRPYDDSQTARDSVLMAVLAYGEGYHNFHHKFAADYRNGIRWYQWDPTKWLIRTLSLPGWTYRLKRVPSPTILEARMQAEQERLLLRGLPADRVAALKQRVEDAQKRWRTLCDDYKTRKHALRAQSREHFIQLKAEMKVARLEFRLACRQWVAFYKTLRGLPVLAR